MKSFASFFQRAFPVPHVLALSDVALSFFDGQLAFFEFTRSKGRLVPKTCGTIPFPKLRREMKADMDLFTKAIGALKEFAEAKKYAFAHVIVHEADAYVFKITVPTLIPDEIHSAVESALEENVPIPPADALFEYEIVSTDKIRNKSVVAVTVISEKMLLDYSELLKSAGIMPVMFDIETRAIARALIKKGDMKTHAVLTIKEHHSTLCVVEKGVVTFSSSIEVGASDFSKSLAKVPESSKDESTVFESTIPVFSTIHDELEKVLLYFKTDAYEHPDGQIVDVILSGSDARLPGFAQYLSVTSKLPVKIGSVWTNILSPEKELPELPEQKSLDYGALIGMYIQ